MGRRRGQRIGHVYLKGPSWLVRWREDVRDAEGNIRRAQFAKVIAPQRDPATGERITKHQAQRIAWIEVLSKLDQATLRPASLMTVEEFIRQRFEPDWVAQLKAAGCKHYGTVGTPDRKPSGQLAQVAAAIGGLSMRAVTLEHVQTAVHRRLVSGSSVQTAVHLRNVISAVFRHAKRLSYYFGENPAEGVRLPEMRRRAARCLSAPDAARVLRSLPRGVIDPARPVFEIVALAAVTSMNVAEILGLRWKRVNLTAASGIVDGEALPPRSLQVRENNYRGAVGSPKAVSRRRTVPLPAAVVRMLDDWRQATPYPGAEDFVFAGGHGHALNETNLRRRVLAPIGKALELPFPLSWHVFRHTHATIAEQIGLPLSERQANMGHAAGAMTMHYTHADVERRREGLEQIAALLGLT